MYGCVFWGYPLAFMAILSGGALIALLAIADKHVKGINGTSTAPSE